MHHEKKSGKRKHETLYTILVWKCPLKVWQIPETSKENIEKSKTFYI